MSVNRMSKALAWVLLAAGAAAGLKADDDLAKELPRIPPLPRDEAGKSFRVREGFQVVPVALDNLVRSPVSAAYDADGRLYVVEMRGYPFPEKPPTGCVKRLEDTDGDGVFDRATVFLDGLNWPTSVVCSGAGVFVVAAPDLLYASDADDDGVAERREVLYRGFGTQNVQALANGLLWGPDGWIYGVSGGNGGDIRDLRHLERPAVSVRGRDFRFRPDGSAFEAISGGGQFGHAFDDWGHRFTCNNSDHIRQIVLPSHYLDRNPAAITASVIADIAAEGPAAPVYRISTPEPWRVVRTRQRVADPAFNGLPPTERVPMGFFTSATGVTIYRGSAFPPEFRGNAFIGDVGGNLVHRKVLTKGEGVFVATRGDANRKSEFLASTDNWFRPVNFANTPGGCLLLLDMQRETIEHPHSIPDPIQKHLDLTSGRDRGRLYEIRPDGFTPRPAPRLSKAPAAELVRHLADADAWGRETAQRLLIERRDPSATPALRDLDRSRPNAAARMHALWTLAALGALEAADLDAAFADPEPGVREGAARLSERFLVRSPELRARLVALAGDSDPMVRLQAAFSLGEHRGVEALSALAAIAARDRASPWIHAAVLSSLAGRAGPFLGAMEADAGGFRDESGRIWLEEVAALAGAERRPEAIAAALRWVTRGDADMASRRAAALGLDRGLRRAGGSLRGFLSGESARGIAPLFASAREEAAAESLPVGRRVEAIRVIAIGPIDEAIGTLPALLDARQPAEVQNAALSALGALPDPRVGPEVVARWKRLGPSSRREAAEVLFARADRLAALLDSIESGAIAPSEIDSARRSAAAKSAEMTLRERAAKLLGGTSRLDRARAIEAFRPALPGGSSSRGAAVFARVCATCHKAEGRGESVGPDLATVASRTADDLLIHILDPNREVAPTYLDYRATLTDGRIVTGRIASETASSIAFQRAGGVTETVPRDQVEQVASSGLSLMPEGLEASLTPSEMADLIAYLRRGR